MVQVAETGFHPNPVSYVYKMGPGPVFGSFLIPHLKPLHFLEQDVCHHIFLSGSACLGIGCSICQSQKNLEPTKGQGSGAGVNSGSYFIPYTQINYIQIKNFNETLEVLEIFVGE